MNTFQAYLELATIDTPDVNVQEYSGRGMYGKTCLGVAGDSREVMSVIAMAIVQACNDIPTKMSLHNYQELVHDALQFKEDTMGRDIIVYWPDMAYETPQDDGDFVDDTTDEE